MTVDLINRLEAEFRAAMLAGDVRRLDALVADDLVFTNQQGRMFGKSEDLEAHRSGLLKLGKPTNMGAQIRQTDDTAVVVRRVELAGRYGGEAFGGSFVYTRVWRLEGDRGRTAVGHCSAIT